MQLLAEALKLSEKQTVAVSQLEEGSEPSDRPCHQRFAGQLMRRSFMCVKLEQDAAWA